MRNITELTVLLRERVALPDHFKLLSEEFREGWDFVQSGDAHWLDMKIRKCGWRFIRVAEGSLKSGVGQAPQEAIASALKLALRCVSVRFNAAEVGKIELKEYPWFILATVRVYPYQIQKSAIVSRSDEPVWMPSPGKVVTTDKRGSKMLATL